MMVVDGSAGLLRLAGRIGWLNPAQRTPGRGFVRLQDHEFFQVLRNKLGWGLPQVGQPGRLRIPVSASGETPRVPT